MEDVRYLMEYSGGCRVKGNMSWRKRNDLEIHYGLTGGLSYNVIKKPKTEEQLLKEEERNRKEE